MMTTPLNQYYYKSLVLMADNDDLEDMEKRLQVARDLGLKTFGGAIFSVIDVVRCQIAPIYQALYRFERSTVPLRGGKGYMKTDGTPKK